MNPANILTLIRFFLAAAFTAFGSLDHLLPCAWFWALILFLIASLTDWFDGHIARKFNLISDFGKLMDPLADKVLVLAALLLLVQNNIFPAWAAIIILTREFLVTGLRLVAASKGMVLAAENLGKHKTISQLVAIIAALSWLALDSMTTNYTTTINAYIKPALPWLYGWALTITVYSGTVYFWKNRKTLSG